MTPTTSGRGNGGVGGTAGRFVGGKVEGVVGIGVPQNVLGPVGSPVPWFTHALRFGSHEHYEHIGVDQVS